MLSKEENELLGHVGPGTPAGELMRQYWLPALLASELPEPDGRPVRLRLLCENLIGFRDSAGKAGILQNNCPHRGASLFFGRNEDHGLRCVYHGWKFDASGRCVDMPNEPPESNFRDKVQAVAYPTEEHGGIVWTYMGPRNEPPPFPDIEPLASERCQVNAIFRDCNWLQALEGDIDTSHLGFLHLGAVEPEQTKPDSFDYYTVRDRAPRYNVVDTEFGTMYGAYRPAEAETDYWRLACYLFPVYTMIPTGVLGVRVGVRAWVPIDDDHTMYWSMSTPAQSFGRSGGARSVEGGQIRRAEDSVYLPNTTDWLGRWRMRQNLGNDYLIDPIAQKTNSFTGITGIFQQDSAVTESMGPLMDRTVEHLGTADAMLIRTRQRILRAIYALRDTGVVPPGVDEPDVYAVRSGSVFLPKGADWLRATADLRKAYTEHPEILAQAEAGRF
ncbi:MAG TPA: Rieske 2Fe-2S domain-containing protein [Dehalococcoidia bacterium]|nr:Rieske 2Fe-2S domain-containing protein [Dehalococcoidia bacterium]